MALVSRRARYRISKYGSMQTRSMSDGGKQSIPDIVTRTNRNSNVPLEKRLRV